MPPMPGTTVYLLGTQHGAYLNTVESYESIMDDLENSGDDYIEVSARFEYDHGMSVARVSLAKATVARVEEWTEERWEAAVERQEGDRDLQQKQRRIQAAQLDAQMRELGLE